MGDLWLLPFQLVRTPPQQGVHDGHAQRAFRQLRADHAARSAAPRKPASAPHCPAGEAPKDGRWRVTDTPWPRVKRYTHATYPALNVEATNSLELRQVLFATRFSRDDLLNSFMKQDGQPVLSPWLSSNKPYLDHLREANVDLRYITSR